MQSVSVFLDIKKFAFFPWKMLMSAELKGCATWYIFWIFFRWGITVPSFIISGYVSQILGRGPFCRSPPPPRIRDQPQKDPSWIGLNKNVSKELAAPKIWKTVQNHRRVKDPEKYFKKMPNLRCLIGFWIRLWKFSDQ